MLHRAEVVTENVRVLLRLDEVKHLSSFSALHGGLKYPTHPLILVCMGSFIRSLFLGVFLVQLQSLTALQCVHVQWTVCLPVFVSQGWFVCVCH